MKKLFILASALIAFTGASSVPVAHATIGDFCTSDASCGANETCDLGTVANPGTNKCVAAMQTPLAPPAPTTQPTNYVQQSSINPSSNPPPTTVNGTGFVPLAPIPGLTDTNTTSVVNSTTLAVFFNNLYKYLIGIAAVLAVIEIIWGGLEIAINKENVSKITDAKGRIVQALFGLVLVLSPVLVFSVINPSILNLSLNLPKLNTAPASQSDSAAGTSGGTQQTTGTNAASGAATGCATPTGTLLVKTTCPTQQAAQNFAASCPNGAGSISSSWFSSQYQVACPTTSGSITGPYAFTDTSTGAISYIVGYSHYEPLASTVLNQNNGNAVVGFASACTADGGTTCMSTVKLPCSFSPTACWMISLSCTNGATGAGGCSTNPQFTVVQN